MSFTCLKVNGISFSYLKRYRFSSRLVISACLNLRYKSYFLAFSGMIVIYPALEYLTLN